MTYIVWTDNRTEGWSRSEDLATMDDCFEYIRTVTMASPYVITKPVRHALMELEP